MEQAPSTTAEPGPRRRGGGSDGSEVILHAPLSAPSAGKEEEKDRGRGFIGRVRSSIASMRPDGTKGLGPLDADYYDDGFNDQPWKCSFGTHESDGIWMNRDDQAGTIMSFLVWLMIGEALAQSSNQRMVFLTRVQRYIVLLALSPTPALVTKVYSGVTIVLLQRAGHLPHVVAMVYCTICALGLASHAKTTYTDPGAVPQAAVPTEEAHEKVTYHTMCSQCQSYKPREAHHCRICNRCISRMDHHCPWMNNCVGAGNMKHFILFLLYTWSGSVFALLIFTHNYFFCSDQSCEFSAVLVQLVRAMTLICSGAFLFTSSMIMNVTYGIMTGVGTIDRMKKHADDTWSESVEEPVPLTDIFGVAYLTWPLPVDPLFGDFDKVMGFSTPQRLLREHRERDMDLESESLFSASTGGYSQV